MEKAMEEGGAEKAREGDKSMYYPICSAIWVIFCSGFVLYFAWDDKYVGYRVAVFLSLLFALICFVELNKVGNNNDPKTQLRYELGLWALSSICISLACAWWVSAVNTSFVVSMIAWSLSVFVVVGSFVGNFILRREGTLLTEEYWSLSASVM
ncbi:hypothetical protein QJS04_geneDACA000566 [Acorus gramineus]|uniref:Uncharacterized protein n=1 Tax=Acorus gramineus TaxID=55184 RepID=A0AAV9AT51_ACOGR|nr:hypothetical protein QJS04_geneDACA000566 [Acorus gramineus]